MERLQIEECLERILGQIRPTERVEAVSLEAADGRILAEDIRARQAVPAFPRSAMDGYAVHSVDVAGATQSGPARLDVVGELFAGDVPGPDAGYGPGTAVRIMTGACVPRPYDAVVRQEDTDYAMDRVAVFVPVKAYQNYCKPGEDIAEGALIARAGVRLTPAHIGLLASLGMARVRVRVPARIAILSTGSELMEAGAPPMPGKIYNSISLMLSASIRRQGLDVVSRGLCGDDEAALARALRGAAEGADFIITTGGVSVGKKDFVPKVLRDLGAQALFQGADIQPGTPTMAAVLEGKVVLALSGNPYAALANFELYFWDSMARFMGSDSFRPVCTTAVMMSDYPKSNPHRRLLRAAWANGEVRLISNVHQASVISNLTECNCFIDLEPSRSVRAGETVRVRLFRAN